MADKPIERWWEKPVSILSMERLDKEGHVGGWLEIGGEARYYEFTYEVIKLGSDISLWYGDENFRQYRMVPGPGWPIRVDRGIARAIRETVEGNILQFPIDLSEPTTNTESGV